MINLADRDPTNRFWGICPLMFIRSSYLQLKLGIYVILLHKWVNLRLKKHVATQFKIYHKQNAKINYSSSDTIQHATSLIMLLTMFIITE